MDNQNNVMFEKVIFVFLPMVLIIAVYPWVEANRDIDKFLSMVLFTIIGVWFLSGLFLHNSNLVSDRIKRAHRLILLALTIISASSCYVMFNLLTKSLHGSRDNIVVDFFMNSEWFQTITLFLFLIMTIYLFSCIIFLLCQKFPRQKEQEELEIKKKIHWDEDVKRIISEKGAIYNSNDRELLQYIVSELKYRSDNHLLQNYKNYFSPKYMQFQNISSTLSQVILKDMRDTYGWELEIKDFSDFFEKHILIYSLNRLLRNFFDQFKTSFESNKVELVHPRSFVLFLYYIDVFNGLAGNVEGHEITNLFFSAKSGRTPSKLQNSSSSKKTLQFLCLFTYFAYEHHLREHNYVNENLASFANQITYIFSYITKHIMSNRHEFNRKYLYDFALDLDLKEKINFLEMKKYSEHMKEVSLNFLKQLNLRRNLFDPKRNDEGEFSNLVIELENRINISFGVV